MKSPFAKSDNTGLIVSIAVGSAVAGAAAFLFLTKKGIEVRNQITECVTNWLNKPEVEEIDHTAYLKHPRKAPKSDISDILAHGVIQENPGITG